MKMRSKSKCFIIICLVLWNLGAVISFIAVKADEEYQLKITEGTTLIYENTKVDEDLLESLSDTTGVEDYEELSKEKKGEQFKLVISNIVEKEDHWSLVVELYRGKDFNEREEDIEFKVYKNPSDLKDEIFEEGNDPNLHFLPNDIEDYLIKLEDMVTEDDRYYEVDYNLYVDDTELTFDYTPTGYSDKIEYKYSEDGILEEFTISCDSEEAFKRELIEISNGSNIVLLITIISTISIIGTIFIVVKAIFKKKKNKKRNPSNSEKLVEKLLNDIVKT